MFNTITKPLLMGILNVTPDSFSDGGQFIDLPNAVMQAKQMMEAGADILDVGGESTRPGSDPVSADIQIERVVPVITAIRQQLGQEALISIDTTLHAVAKAALNAGANMINDISAGLHDTQMFSLAATRDVPIILMHMQGSPKTMQENPVYVDVVAEVMEHLQKRVTAALHAGIKAHNIVIDPGIGFGKRKVDNLQLLAHLQQFVDSGYPVLLGTSRKRFMGTICSVNSPADLVTATAVTTALGVMAGVKIFRVHDVPENRQALDIAWAIKTADEQGER
ncbi:MAG: dihydropteroate synthase [Methylococcales bacterium]